MYGNIMALPGSLSRDISPPQSRCKRRRLSGPRTNTSAAESTLPQPSLAEIEAGQKKIKDHLVYFRERLSSMSRGEQVGQTRINFDQWADLYTTNKHEHGNHFVVHQHNHPVSGLHYDLRLQFSTTSSMSFALPKGLPGNPNSKSPGRVAIETRVHNYWNHLIESASMKTGSLLIWDTGTYSVLPHKSTPKKNDPQSSEGSEEEFDQEALPLYRARVQPTLHENDKLIQAFRARHIKLRLHGVRLARNYTVSLRLSSNNHYEINTSGTRHRKRRRTRTKVKSGSTSPSSLDNDEIATRDEPQNMDTDDDDDEEIQTRLTNAYPGSHNSIGSVHQRRWFMLLDRTCSGFVKDPRTRQWVRRSDADGDGFETFFVRGRDVERSVLTGRLAKEVESDEGVAEFVGRGGWTGIMH